MIRLGCCSLPAWKTLTGSEKTKATTPIPLRTTASRPGPRPPYHAAKAVATRQVPNGTRLSSQGRQRPAKGHRQRDGNDREGSAAATDREFSGIVGLPRLVARMLRSGR